MNATQATVLIMAGGTGGHIFPALAIARRLRDIGLRVEWLGARRGMEADLVPRHDIPLHLIAVSGLRGKGPLKLLLAPVMLVTALWQALAVIRRVKPGCVLGMGGFASGPGGLAAWLTRVPLLIHEQNAVPGMTNRWLSRLATRVMEAFPGTFGLRVEALHTGNPVRSEIAALGATTRDLPDAARPLRVLVMGGSQGATAINEALPQLLADWQDGPRPQVVHQTGARHLTDVEAAYRARGLTPDDGCEVRGFIDDMALLYQWADVVVARSGASTVCELAAAAVPAILIPYPWHRDQQQLHNARWLVAAGAAILLPQADLTAARLGALLRDLSHTPKQLTDMRAAARQLAILDADRRIAAQCQEVLND